MDFMKRTMYVLVKAFEDACKVDFNLFLLSAVQADHLRCRR
jgi:hypothetical protein